MKPLFPAKIHTGIHYFALALLTVALPLSVFMMSLAQLILAGNWILEGDLGTKFRKFATNKSALVLSSVVLLHLLGLLYTSDLHYGLEDVKKKLPLLALPLILSSSPLLSKKQFGGLMAIFIAAVTIGTLISMGVLFEVIHSRKAPLPITDIRQTSIFISHVRFSLLICIAVCLLGYYAVKKHTLLHKVLLAALALWLVFFLVILESLTGLLVIALVLFVLGMYYVMSRDGKSKKIVALVILLAAIGAGTWYINSLVDRFYQRESVDMKRLETKTALGGDYVHDIKSTEAENGHYTWLYVCWSEMEETWGKRSKLGFNGKDLKGNDLRYTLVRFLSSLGLRKDAEGVNKLSEAQVAAVEKGIANADYMGRVNIKGRINQIIWEIDNYKQGKNFNGHSLAQRFEYWKTAWGIIVEQPFFGVGTGDVKKAFEASYEENHSLLEQRWRLRSHNQFLAIATAFGFFGLGWFLFSLFYPAIKERKLRDYFYVVFFITACVSFFSEDTLETQPGVTFFALFNCLFLFLKPADENP